MIWLIFLALVAAWGIRAARQDRDLGLILAGFWIGLAVSDLIDLL